MLLYFVRTYVLAIQFLGLKQNIEQWKRFGTDSLKQGWKMKLADMIIGYQPTFDLAASDRKIARTVIFSYWAIEFSLWIRDLMTSNWLWRVSERRAHSCHISGRQSISERKGVKSATVQVYQRICCIKDFNYTLICSESLVTKTMDNRRYCKIYKSLNSLRIWFKTIIHWVIKGARKRTSSLVNRETQSIKCAQLQIIWMCWRLEENP